MYSTSTMSEVNAKEHLEKEREKLAALMLEQERIAVEIAKTKRRMAAWAELAEESDIALPPLTLISADLQKPV